MTTKRILPILLFTLFCLLARADGKYQKFFNLTAEEVKIDSVLPHFAYSLPLGAAWADSVYTVRIEYPEFIEMSRADVERYRKISSKTPGDMPEVLQNVVVERKKGKLETSFVPVVVRKGKYMKLVSFMLDVISRPISRSTRRAKAAAYVAPAERYAARSVLAEGRWAKIRVPSTGIYQITDALIRRAGFSDMSRVKVYGYGGALQSESLNPAELVETDDLKEVATCTVDGKRLFYARGPVSWSSERTLTRTRNPYSDYGYYFLTESDGEPLAVDSTALVDAFYPSADDYHVLYEKDEFAWMQGGRNLFENEAINVGSPKSYVINTAEAQAGPRRIYVKATAGSATTVKIELKGYSERTYSLTFGEYDHGKAVEFTYNQNAATTADTIVVTTVSGGPVRLDYISVAYETPRPRPILRGMSFDTPEYVYNITNQNLHGDGPADMVIIVPASGKLNAQAQRLKEFHEQHDGMRVRLVPADELYNEFSSGTPDANAYRRYLKMLYDRAETDADMPSYLILFGDGVWDNRMKTAACRGLSPDDFLLCYESENSFSATDCYVDEGFFCLLDDGEGGLTEETDKQDIAVGRFPVREDSEAKIMVDKTISYIENKNAGSWQNVMMFMGDDGNNNQHMIDADDLARLVESRLPSMNVKRVMWDAYNRETSSTGNTYPDATRLIKQQQQAGALLMNYSGHGGPGALSHENVLRRNDFAAFTNTNLPLWITASCDIMPFDMLNDNIGEIAVLNENGGAVAFFGTTRTVWIPLNKHINRAYMEALVTPVNGKYVSIGEAQRLAKNQLINLGLDTSENKLQYQLLGDPAIVLNMPRQALVIDNINGVELSSATEYPALKAGSVVNVKGHVETADGQKDTSFDGILTATVMDAEEEIVCKLNNTSDDGASTAFVYYDRDKTLFSGNDSIRGGEFDFSFAVTKDIKYTDETGLMNLFAVNADTKESVNGYTEDFVVGGTALTDNDLIGPSIYCYLNSPSFTNGDKVNPAPYFVAEISDKDGINTAGSGIGHDLVLTIDGKMEHTYVLNANFTYDFGSYTSGKTFYNIPELEEGKHTIRFRAWDILNNSSTAELTFNVVRGIRPGYLNVSTTSNPARTSTTFIINHDRAGSNLDVQIDVFDISGRPLWRHKSNGVSTDGAFTVDWDLTGSNGGKLHTGIYIYRVKVSSDGSESVSKAQKLIIIDR